MMKKQIKNFLLWFLFIIISIVICIFLWRFIIFPKSQPIAMYSSPTITYAESYEEPYIKPDIRSFITYTDLGVPEDVDTSFKTWMDWRCITDKTSDQYEYINQWGWCDEEGFMRAGYENDLEVTDDYYMIALGSYYGTTIGTKYRITTDLGNVFYGVLSDVKDDRHTNSTNQYAKNKDVVEFLVDTRYLNKNVKRMGSANVHPELKGKIAKIERIDFID